VHRSRVLAVSLALAVAVAVAACGGGDGDERTKRRQAPPTTEAPPVAPLTGLPDPDGQAQGRPALTVKVDNLCDREACVRPQTGLEAADVVYEEVTEGNITRFAAVFQSQVPAEVGPIRSVRAIDPDLVWPLGGVFAYSGGAPPNLDRIRAAPVNSIDETQGGDAMFRSDTKKAPHDLFGRGQALFDRGGQPVPPPPLFTFSAGDAVPAGEPVAAFTVGFVPAYAPTYTYDAATRTWKRDIGGQPFVAANGAQIAPTNVIVQFTQYTGGGEGNVIGEGEAWVLSGGQLVRGRWVRPVREQPAQYLDAAGTPIELLPGTTWVELLPIGAPVAVTAPAPPAPPPT
jgi:Protein of unknown function (DUF3048) N-terminal domain/Protein of unknown function (DUF3048) C-terminal domain